MKYGQTLTGEIKSEFESRLQECWNKQNPGVCAQELIHEFQKRLAPPPPPDFDKETLYVMLIQIFLFVLTNYGEQVGAPNVTVSYREDRNFTYIGLPKIIPQLAERAIKPTEILLPSTKHNGNSEISKNG